MMTRSNSLVLVLRVYDERTPGESAGGILMYECRLLTQTHELLHGVYAVFTHTDQTERVPAEQIAEIVNVQHHCELDGCTMINESTREGARKL